MPLLGQKENLCIHNQSNIEKNLVSGLERVRHLIPFLILVIDFYQP